MRRSTIAFLKSGNSDKPQMTNEKSQLQNDKYYNYSNQNHKESRIMAAKDFRKNRKSLFNG